MMGNGFVQVPKRNREKQESKSDRGRRNAGSYPLAGFDAVNDLNADMVNALKSNSSRWIHEEQKMSIFRWQEGYGAFSVSRSNEEAVASYIKRQKEHHPNRDFKSEFLEFLLRHEVEYDPRYIWE